MVVDGEFAELPPGASSAATRRRSSGCASASWRVEGAAGDRARAVSERAERSAFWVMTSGTTGSPQAVEHRHANVGICAQYSSKCSTPNRRPPVRHVPVSFAYALGTMFAALRLGATNILLERWATRQRCRHRRAPRTHRLAERSGALP